MFLNLYVKNYTKICLGWICDLKIHAMVAAIIASCKLQRFSWPHEGTFIVDFLRLRSEKVKFHVLNHNNCYTAIPEVKEKTCNLQLAIIAATVASSFKSHIHPYGAFINYLKEIFTNHVSKFSNNLY